MCKPYILVKLHYCLYFLSVTIRVLHFHYFCHVFLSLINLISFVPTAFCFVANADVCQVLICLYKMFKMCHFDFAAEQ